MEFVIVALKGGGGGCEKGDMQIFFFFLSLGPVGQWSGLHAAGTAPIQNKATALDNLPTHQLRQFCKKE